MTLLLLRAVEGALRINGETLVERLIVPVNPFWLVRIMFDVPDDPFISIMLGLLAEMAKSGPVLLKLAVCTVSGSGFMLPLAMVTHVVVPLTLLEEQPVWNPTGIDPVPVTL